MKPVEKSSGAPGPQRPGGRRCPLCGEGEARAFRPFCSRRCTDLDLGRWLSDVYVIASVSLSVAGEDEES